MARLTLHFGGIILPMIMSALKGLPTSSLPVTKRHQQKMWLFLFHKLKVITQDPCLRQLLVHVSEQQVNSALVEKMQV